MLNSNALFQPKYELVQLIAPVVLLLAALIEIVYSHRHFSSSALTLNFIQNILFLNSLHVWFTFLLLWSNKDGRQWTAAMFRSQGFVIRCLAVFLFFAGFYIFYREEAPKYQWGSTVVEAILIFSGRFHEVAQSRGVSLLYDLKFGAPDLRSRKEFKAIQWSQTAFGASSAVFSLLVLSTYQTQSPLYNFVEKSFRSPLTEVVFWLSLFVSLFCLVTLFICTARLYPVKFKELRRKKLLFNMRYVIKLLSYHSSIAAFFSNATHGVEYLAVYSKLDSAKLDSQNNRAVTNRTYLCFLTVSVILFILFRYPFLFGTYVGISDDSIVVSTLMGVIAGLTFLHYFLDGFLFKYRSPLSRQLIFKNLIDHSISQPGMKEIG